MSNVSSDGTMTSKERVLNILARKPVDHVPCFSGMGNVTLAGIRDYGWEFASLHTDPIKMAMAAASTPKLFGYDCAVVPFDMGVEAEGLAVKSTITRASRKVPKKSTTRRSKRNT